MLDRYLNDLEKRIDPEQELTLEQDWIHFAEGRKADGPFSPPCRQPALPTCDWPEININDAINDDDLMLLSQFKLCSDYLATGSNLLMAVRTNYGVGIIPSFFGSEPFIMPFHMNCLPNVRPLAGGSEAIRTLISKPLPALDQGYGPQIIRLADRFQEIRRRYPKIGRFIRMDHPDGQGPFDIVELLWGSDVFYALYDDSELVLALLDHICHFYITFFDHWFQMAPPTDAYHAYAGRLHRGLITIRDDSAMNLSPALCREFVHPYDARLLEHFGGGAIHFCGRGDHHIADMVLSKGLSAIDLSQPHLNDMRHIVSQTIDRGINLHTVSSDNLQKIDLSAHARHRLSLR